ncbi:hypothetical protein KR093_004252, partial [Drosophila rubida]
TINMQPSRRFQEIAESISYYAESLGMPILSPRLVINYRFGVTSIAVTSYALFSFLWIFKKADESWTECLKATMMMGGMISGGGEVLTLVLKHSEIVRLFDNTRQVFEEYQERAANYADALNVGIDRVVYISKWIRNGYVVSYILMTSIPLLCLAYDGSRVTILPYEIPGISPDSNSGYILINLIQLVSMIISAIGFYVGDMLVTLVLTQILTFADILVIKVSQLNKVLALKAEARLTSLVGAPYANENDVEIHLIDTIKWHQLLTDYCKMVDDTYKLLITCQVLASAFSMLTTFCVNLNALDFIGVIYFLVSTYKMMLFCLVGTKIEYAYDEVYESICNISWHELNGSQRKMFALMLKKAQSTEIMVMLGILPLSVRTALQASCFWLPLFVPHTHRV